MMSMNDFKQYWSFKRVKIKDVNVSPDKSFLSVVLVPNKKYLPICSGCKRRLRRIHSYHKRIIRDMPFGPSKTYLELHYRKLYCPHCGIRKEYHNFLAPYSRVTQRFAQMIFDLCQKMSVYDVARHVGLNWHQVKEIDRSELIERHTTIDFSKLEIICMDEISIRKRHNYLTLIADYQTGRVIGVIKDRDYRSIEEYFSRLSQSVLNKIKAVVMDMWDPYIKAVHQYCKHAAIVFDKFHVIAAFNRTLDRIRNQEYDKASKDNKRLLKGTKYIFFKHPSKLRDTDEKPRLDKIFLQNVVLAKAYLLKEYLNTFWTYDTPKLAEGFINHWCQIALDAGSIELTKFVRMIKKHLYGIINHSLFQINNAQLEGINNKAKVIKRRAYGYLDYQYFGYKIMQATTN